MTNRNKKQKERLNVESQRLHLSYPNLSLQPQVNDWASVTGTIEIDPDMLPEIGYTVQLVLPPKYPQEEPLLICNRVEIPWKIDRHVYEKNGIACLCARSEMRMHWPQGSDLCDFIDNLVVPFFLGQNYYDAHGCWPPTGERSHGKPGIIDSYTELLTEINNLDQEKIRSFMQIIAQKKNPGGHMLCPCGSRKKLRNCHRDLIIRLRSNIDPRHAKADFKEAFNNEKTLKRSNL